MLTATTHREISLQPVNDPFSVVDVYFNAMSVRHTVTTRNVNMNECSSHCNYSQRQPERVIVTLHQHTTPLGACVHHTDHRTHNVIINECFSQYTSTQVVTLRHQYYMHSGFVQSVNISCCSAGHKASWDDYPTLSPASLRSNLSSHRWA